MNKVLIGIVILICVIFISAIVTVYIHVIGGIWLRDYLDNTKISTFWYDWPLAEIVGHKSPCMLPSPMCWGGANCPSQLMIHTQSPCKMKDRMTSRWDGNAKNSGPALPFISKPQRLILATLKSHNQFQKVPLIVRSPIKLNFYIDWVDWNDWGDDYISGWTSSMIQLKAIQAPH